MLEKNKKVYNTGLKHGITLPAEISNSIDDLPLILGNLASDFKNIDLIIPNRVRLRKNNDRNRASSIKVTGNF